MSTSFSDDSPKKGRKPRPLKPQSPIAKRLAPFVNINKISEYSSKIYAGNGKRTLDQNHLRKILAGKVNCGIEKFAEIIQALGPEAIASCGYILTGVRAEGAAATPAPADRGQQAITRKALAEMRSALDRLGMGMEVLGSSLEDPEATRRALDLALAKLQKVKPRTRRRESD